jgi:hypothetical protein
MQWPYTAIRIHLNCAIRSGVRSRKEHLPRHLGGWADLCDVDDTGKVIRTEEHVQVIPLKKHSKPDTTAQIFHLKNRRPDQWRDNKKAEHEADADTPRTFTGMAALEFLKREGFVLLEGEYTIADDTASETIADE